MGPPSAPAFVTGPMQRLVEEHSSRNNKAHYLHHHRNMIVHVLINIAQET